MAEELGGCVVDVQVANLDDELVSIPGDLIVEELTIRHGRTSVETTAIEPGVASFTVYDETGDLLPLMFDLRRRVVIKLSTIASTYWSTVPATPTLFVGRIVEVSVEPFGVGGAPLYVRITANSQLAELGRTFVGTSDWPAETVPARFARLCARSGVPMYEVPVPSVPWFVIPRVAERANASDVLSNLSAGTLDLLVERVTSDELALVSYRKHVSGAAETTGGPTYLTLDQCWVATDWASSITLAGVVNYVAVTYDPVPAVGERPVLIVQDAKSITAYGYIESAITSDLDTTVPGASDAVQDTFGNLLIDSRQPRAEVPVIVFDLWRTCPVSVGTELLSDVPPSLHPSLEDMSARQVCYASWTLQDFPIGFPVNRDGAVWLEGLTHTISRESWQVVASVVDPWPGAGALRWDDVASATTWDSVPADVVWDYANSGVS